MSSLLGPVEAIVEQVSELTMTAFHERIAEEECGTRVAKETLANPSPSD